MSAVLRIDLGAIESNARSICRRLATLDVSVAGVTKAVCGDPAVARRMLAGGCAQIADSRLANLALQQEDEREFGRDAGGESGPPAQRWLLRAPEPSEAAAVVGVADLSLVTEIATLGALSSAAAASDVVHRVLLMVEIGDLREGLAPEKVPSVARTVEGLPCLELAGIGANLTCLGAVIPDESNLGLLAETAARVESSLGRQLRWVSGGATSSLRLAFSGRLPGRINHLRIGEGILLGKDTIDRSDLPGTRQDAFMLRAPIVEIATKPSVPSGRIGQDSWGRTPCFEDRGARRRACVAIGRQDIGGGTLTPLDEGVEVLGASADLVVCDVEEAAPGLVAGSVLSFRPDYAALTALSTSPYVEKQHV